LGRIYYYITSNKIICRSITLKKIKMNIRILRRRGLGNGSTLGIKQFSNNNIEIIRNDREIPEDTDLLIRWGCTSQFPSKKTLNKADAISTINNKYLTRKLLKQADVNIPELYRNTENVKYPCIVRPHNHSQGKNLFLCNNEEELIEAEDKMANEGKNIYVSEYIKKDREFGIFIFNNRIWSVIEKVSKVENGNDEVAWNVAQGTHSFENVRWNDWDMNICKEALDAVKCFNIDFCRVDIIVKDNIPYILELNSAHSLTSDYRKKSFAKCLDYYIENGYVKNQINLGEVKSYKSIIHPALRINNLGKNL
jgi:glutathione synthase/RimK-type ligase-like ATP-grasp enzyme